MVILPFCKQPGLCMATIVFLGDVNHRHESLKIYCDSEKSVKFEKYGWKNAVLSAYLMRGVFLQPSVMSPILLALIILHLFDETT